MAKRDRKNKTSGDLVPIEGTELWDRQPQETDLAWTAFQIYRDLRPRTLRQAAEILGPDKPPSYRKQLESWSADNHWRQRVEAWDIHRDRTRTQTELETIKEESRRMVRRHLNLSTKLQNLAETELNRWIHALEAQDPEEAARERAPTLPPKQIQELLDYAIKLERLNRGEPESITETRSTKLTREEIEVRIQHLLKVREIEPG